MPALNPSLEAGTTECQVLTLTAQGAGNVNGANQTNTQARGIVVGINITAISGTTPTLTVTIQGIDAASGTQYTLLASAALNATGFSTLTVYPGITASANVSANNVVPSQWRVIAVVGGTGPSVTATISPVLIP